MCKRTKKGKRSSHNVYFSNSTEHSVLINAVIQVLAHTDTHVHVHTHTHTRAHAHTHTHTNTRVYTHTQFFAIVLTPADL